jgi:hypothetical protein
VIGLCGVAALAISPLALTLPAQAASPVSGVTTAAPSAAHGGRPDPTYTPADRREAIAQANQDRAATADRLRLGGKEAQVVKDVLRDPDGTTAVSGDPIRERIELRLRARVQHDCGASIGQRDRCTAAPTAGRAGHDHYLPVEPNVRHRSRSSHNVWSAPWPP